MTDRVEQFIRHPGRALLRLALPMIVGFSAHALYAVVDSFFIGKLGPEALAASGYIASLFFVAIALTTGLATGITAAVANAYGGRDGRRLNRIATTGLVVSIGIGVVFSLVGMMAGKSFISLLGAEGQTVHLAWDYMVPLWVGMPLFFFTTAIRSVITGEGDARTPMVILILSTALNAVLDPVFIFLLDMGIGGAAWATVCAQSFALITLAWVALGKSRITSRFEWYRPTIDMAELKRIVGVGGPAAAGHLVMSAGMILSNRVVSEFGQTAVAGYVAGSRVDMLVALPLLGIASAAMTLTGIFAGAGRMELVRETTVHAYRWAIVASVAIGGPVYLFSPHIISLFVSDVHAHHVGTQYINYVVLSYPLMAVGMTTGRVLQGMGWGWPSLVITAVRVLFIGGTASVVSVYLFHAPLEAVWLSFVAGGVGSMSLAAVWIRKKLWQEGV